MNTGPHHLSASLLRRRLLVVLVALFLVGLVGLLALGDRFFVVSSPSMSPGIPVGALAVTEPLGQRPASVGEVLVGRPPGQHRDFIHQVVTVLPGPAYRTKGRLNASEDPWVLPQRNVSGRVVAVLPDLGWLVRMAPISIGIALVGLVAARLVERRLRPAVAGATSALALAVPSIVVHPFIHVMVARAIGHGHHATAFTVNVGILPAEVDLNGGPARLVAPGHPAVLQGPAAQGHFFVHAVAAPSWWTWLGLILLACAPLVVALLASDHRGATTEEGTPASDAALALGPSTAR